MRLATTLLGQSHQFRDLKEVLASAPRLVMIDGFGEKNLIPHCSMSRSHKDGGLPPDSVVQTDKEIMAHTEIGRAHV